MSNVDESRRFIRHPTDIPVRWNFGEVVPPSNDHLRNISEGGLAFESHQDIPVGARIEISIPVVRPQATLSGEVVYCRPIEDSGFEVGIRFSDAGYFKMRMVEQVCHIELYKKSVLETEGRTLSSAQAAEEWIKRFAKNFPP